MPAGIMINTIMPDSVAVNTVGVNSNVTSNEQEKCYL